MTKQAFSLSGLWRVTSPPLGQLVLGLLLSMGNTAVSLAIPLFIKKIMDALAEKLSPSLLAGLIALLLLQVVTSALSLFILARVGQQIVRQLRTKTWRKLLALPVSYYDRHHSGEMISRVTNDTTVVMNLLSTEMVQVVTSFLSVIVSVVILFTLDVPMTAVLLTAVPITFLIVMPIGRKMYRLSYEQQNRMSDVTAFLTQMLSEIRLIKASTTEGEEFERGSGKFDSLFEYGVKKAKIQSILAPLMTAVMTTVLVVIIGYGAYRVSEGLITSGELVAFVLYLFQIIIPVGSISRFVTSFQETKGATERLFQILAEQEENHEGTECIEAPRELVFEEVGFGYGGELVLRNVSFAARQGTITAFVGPSGVGKTTVFSLMERFYEPSEGRIRLNDVPASHIPLREWRRLFSYVPQDAPMLTGSVRDNITYGMNRAVTEEEVQEAARLANAHAFISQFPDGYDTWVGERGITLSGGQRQRIAIARALLRDPQFLLLDEATASLDSESERLVQESLDTLLQGRTAFVIAHRLSTVVDADQIIVMENGTVTGVGTHAELLREHDFYRTLVQQQFHRGSA
ncbi:ABC transporter ATP-binding protein [Ectobacillus ponti]